ncbi:Adenylate kinase 2 [Hyella patelloides LEGE 07179]|uniref:Adenylate kinase n=1 Tax=Hyella patelloides LEGE 07179 TaxID=945734 RepID=A0A563VXA9_9CYAN|nr:nucleoside monophosphate kinase [Hyella patelloides]VEP16035.1 Adenylate kinase 2 [Hyella patelloides LEGE 07179]
MKLVILGGTGSGKGTQTAKISSNFAIPSISIGEVLRTGIATRSDLGKQAKPYVEQGELVPDELMIQFIKQRLLEPDVKNGWILEGYPRTAFQAEELDFLLGQLKQRLDWAIYLKVSDSIMAARALSRGLTDDISEVIQRRIQNFQDFTVPILEYYQYSDRLLTIDGEQSPEKVAQEIASHLPS